MLTWKPIYQRSKGFTLVELMLALGLACIIMVPLYNLLNFSTRAYDRGCDQDDLMLNARYAIEYIKREVKLADSVIASDEVIGLNAKYKPNVGFVIVSKSSDKLNRYTTYYVKNKDLIRISGEVGHTTAPNYNHLSGYNDICEGVDSLGDSYFDKENNLINLDLRMKSDNGDSLNLKSDIFIRCNLND